MCSIFVWFQLVLKCTSNESHRYLKLISKKQKNQRVYTIVVSHALASNRITVDVYNHFKYNTHTHTHSFMCIHTHTHTLHINTCNKWKTNLKIKPIIFVSKRIYVHIVTDERKYKRVNRFSLQFFSHFLVFLNYSINCFGLVVRAFQNSFLNFSVLIVPSRSVFLKCSQKCL